MLCGLVVVFGWYCIENVGMLRVCRFFMMLLLRLMWLILILL